jgi:hypothetical protein
MIMEKKNAGQRRRGGKRNMVREEGRNEGILGRANNIYFFIL